MSRATRVAVAVSLAWAAAAACCSGCSTTEVAEAAAPTRYRSEGVKVTNYYAGACVITDTETGDRWLVAYTTEGGVAIEPMDGGEGE